MSDLLGHSDLVQKILSTKIESLGLSVRSYNSLKRAGIDSLNQIIDLGEDGVTQIRGLGQLQLDEIFNSIADYLEIPKSALVKIDTSNPPPDKLSMETSEAINKNDIAYDENVPKSPSPSPPPKDTRPFIIEIVSEGLPNPIEYIVPLSKEILQRITPERGPQSSTTREFEIIKRRFGLQGSKEYTLQEIGYYYDLTRERVRQLEARAISKISDIIFGVRNSHAWRVPENLVDETNTLFQLLQATSDLLTETEIIAIVEPRYNFKVTLKRVPDLRFLLNVFGFKALPNKLAGFGREFAPGWIVSETIKPQMLYQTAKSVHRIINSSASPISSFDLMIEVNRRKKKKINKHYVRLAAKILIDVEKLGEESYQIKFEFLASLADRAYRLLIENNKSLHLRELQRKINHRLAKQGLPADASIRNLGNQLATDSRFKAIGRSGLWSLAEWENIYRKTIVELMEEFFHIKQTSATATEIYEYVSTRRSDISKQSVYTYLSMHDSFVKVDKKLYELAAWGSRPVQPRNRKTTKEIKEAFVPAVKEIFNGTPGKSMPLRDLIRTLQEQTSIPEPTLYLHIKKTSLLQVKSDPPHKRRKLVIYTGESESSTPDSVKKMTLREMVIQEVEKYLQRQPNRKATVASLIPHIKKTTGCGKQTFYRYLSDMTEAGLVRKDYEGRRLVCFLATEEVFETEVPLTFPQLEQISDRTLKEQLGRAIKNLNVDNVDLGLFHLGKIFENELKAFLVEAQRKEKYNISSRDLARLVSMIDCVERNGIVRQKHHLTLLREHRNERAHGEIPDIEERKRLMQHAPFLGDLYIKYISFFNEQRGKL